MFLYRFDVLILKINFFKKYIYYFNLFSKKTRIKRIARKKEKIIKGKQL
jgi:hypothetical protein